MGRHRFGRNRCRHSPQRRRPTLVVSGRRSLAVVVEYLVTAQFATPRRSVFIHARSTWRFGVLDIRSSVSAAAGRVAIVSRCACREQLGNGGKLELRHPAISRGNDLARLLWRLDHQLAVRHLLLRYRIRDRLQIAFLVVAGAVRHDRDRSDLLDPRQPDHKHHHAAVSKRHDQKLAVGPLAFASRGFNGGLDLDRKPS